MTALVKNMRVQQVSVNWAEQSLSNDTLIEHIIWLYLQLDTLAMCETYTPPIYSMLVLQKMNNTSR